MIKHTVHCDVCLRPQGSPRGWFGVVEVLTTQVIDVAQPIVRVARTLMIDPLTPENAPSVTACCGVECLTKQVHVFTDRLLREHAEAGS